MRARELIAWILVVLLLGVLMLFRGPSLTDMGCGLRLIKREALQRIQPYFSVAGSHFAPEMTVLVLLAGIKMVEIPVNYCERTGISKITGVMWRAILVGLQMIGLILRYRLQAWVCPRRVPSAPRG